MDEQLTLTEAFGFVRVGAKSTEKYSSVLFFNYRQVIWRNTVGCFTVLISFANAHNFQYLVSRLGRYVQDVLSWKFYFIAIEKSRYF
jgi:hypothetical protein